MKLSIMQKNLKRAMDILIMAVDAKPYMWILGHTLIQANDDSTVMLSTTDLDVYISVTVGANVHETGVVAIPAKTFKELLSHLAPERVDISVSPETHIARVICGSNIANINGGDGSEFPAIPKNELSPTFIVSGKLLRDMIAQVEPTISRDNGRPILNGMYIEVANGTLTMAGADTHRLTISASPVEVSSSITSTVVIPLNAMKVVMKAFGDSDLVHVCIPERYGETVTFYSERTTVSSLSLEGIYPDFRAVVPKQIENSATVLRADFLKAIKRAAIFAKSNNNVVNVALSDKNEVAISSNGDSGDNKNIVSATVEGKPFVFSCNVKFLLEFLDAVDDEYVTLRKDEVGPVTLQGNGSDKLICIVMPMNKV